MSSHQYVVDPNNLFEDEDVDDDTFVNSFRSRNPGNYPQQTAAPKPYSSHIADMEHQRQAMLDRQREIAQRTYDSTVRSIGLLRDSEDIGNETARELSNQREALENTNKRLDEINTNLNYSQKHLNGIKSVFYGLKNYISGKSEQTPSKSQVSSSPRSAGPSSSKLNSKLDDLSKSDDDGDHFRSHPLTRLRGLDQQDVAAPVMDSQRVNEMLDANLDEMVQTITRLKGLGAALGEEIDQQNILIETIHDKVEGADIRIAKQNKQMNKLLGK